MEERQVFKDGRERQRRLATSLTEKLKPKEKPDDAAKRAISEELGIKDIAEPQKKGEYTVLKPSEIFPGLKSNYNAFMFEVRLNADQFKPEGYIEEQADKTTCFVWEKQE